MRLLYWRLGHIALRLNRATSTRRSSGLWLVWRKRAACFSQMPVERLYREIRALRIYEGATEVQQLIIARELLKGGA